MNSNPAKTLPDFFVGGREMGKLIGSMDWSHSPLGPIDGWPQSLRTAVSLCLATEFPILLAWGPRHVLIYNDGYWPICGDKHPRSMGQDFTECWASAWPVIGEAFELALAGQASYLENQRMFLDRKGYLEETFFTFSFSPIRDEGGGVGGLFNPVTEQTGKMLSARRTRALHDLGARTGRMVILLSARAGEEARVEGLAAGADDYLVKPFSARELLARVDSAVHLARVRREAATRERDLQAMLVAERGRAELSEAQGRQRVSDAKYRQLMAQAQDAILVLDLQGIVREANPKSESILGHARTDIVGRPFEALFLPVQQADLNVLLHDSSGLVELHLIRGDGERRDIEVSASRVDTDDEQIVLLIARDVSDRKRVERLKDEFVSTVSHELRTPLTCIAASLGLLEGTADAKLSGTTKRLIAIAHSNSQRLVRLTNDILDIEKMESGKVVFNLRRVEVRSLVAQAIEANRALAEDHGVSLRLEESSTHEVRADPDRLMQVIANLLSNAIKFSPSEAPVVVGIEAPGEQVRITVRDHGPGIPKDFRSRIFEKFAQADATAARQKGGTGLGLSIVKQLVLMLGGEVGFSDAAGGGTIFYVDLPRVAPVDQAERGENQDDVRPLSFEDEAPVRGRLRQQGSSVTVFTLPDGS
jgi:PAS domain S-box-containing protein